MEDWAFFDWLDGDHRQRGAEPSGLPGPGRSRTDSDEQVTATLTSLHREIALLQEATESLRELAHTQQATAHRPGKTRDPVQQLAPGYNAPPPQLDTAESQPRRPADRGRRPIEEPLTRIEEAVLRRLTTTLSLREISRERNVARDTIKGQARSIYRKLGVSDRHEAVQRARELGLLARRNSLSPGSGEPR